MNKVYISKNNSDKDAGGVRSHSRSIEGSQLSKKSYGSKRGYKGMKRGATIATSGIDPE